MSSDRPDYTGSIVIEDIESVTAVITVTGAVSITGDITITNSTFSVTQSGDWIIKSITGTVTVTGNVAVTGTVAISGSVTVTGTVAISGSVTVTGTVAISGSVTVTGTVAISGSVTITGSVSITSGDVDVTIAGSDVKFIIDVSMGLRNILLVATDALSGDGESIYYWTALSANTDYCDVTVVPTGLRNYELVAMIIGTAATTLRIYRDGVLLKSSATTLEQMTIITHEDENVPAGSHTYTIQVADADNAYAILYVIDEEMNMSSGTEAETGSGNVYRKIVTTVTSKAITLAEAGDVYIVGLVASVSMSPTFTLKRGTTTLDTFASSDHPTAFSYLDEGLAAGTYTYTVTVPTSNCIGGMALVSNGGGTEYIPVTPYWQNLNIGLDTRLPKATTPIIYNVTMTDADTEYSQALPSNCKKFLIQTQDGTAFRVAYVTGKVATPTAPYLTLTANVVYWEDFIEESAQTLYFACDDAGKIIEIVAWS